MTVHTLMVKPLEILEQITRIVAAKWTVKSQRSEL